MGFPSGRDAVGTGVLVGRGVLVGIGVGVKVGRGVRISVGRGVLVRISVGLKATRSVLVGIGDRVWVGIETVTAVGVAVASGVEMSDELHAMAVPTRIVPSNKPNLSIRSKLHLANLTRRVWKYISLSCYECSSQAGARIQPDHSAARHLFSTYPLSSQN